MKFDNYTDWICTATNHCKTCQSDGVLSCDDDKASLMIGLKCGGCGESWHISVRHFKKTFDRLALQKRGCLLVEED